MGNEAKSLARRAVGQMKEHMVENVATPSSSQGAVVEQLGGEIKMALPKRASLSRVLRRHRQVQTLVRNGQRPLPALPVDMNFDIPDQFHEFLIHDSGVGENRLLVFGDRDLLAALGTAKVWLADGTFKVVPTLFYQLYTVHFEFPGGLNPPAVYCLLPNKSQATYQRLVSILKNLLPNAAPQLILIDFEAAAIAAFRTGYPTAVISGCYFHLTQSVMRKVQEVGLKQDYEANNEIRGFIRCLPALSHVPIPDVITVFEELLLQMPTDERIEEVVTYFERTYIRGRRLPGRGERYAPPIFAIDVWNKFDAAGEGIARTTNSVEGWHFSLQSIFLCHHPSMWTFLTGIKRDSHLCVTAYSQASTGAVHLGRKKYRDLKERVMRTVATYGQTPHILYLRAISFLSYD
jgi:hypothetical protein